MKKKISAGLVVYRFKNGALEVFVAHPGGPLFAHKDEGHWSIPKGEVEPGEELPATAIREFEEEIGVAIDPGSTFVSLGSILQKGGKRVHAWAVEQDWDDSQPIRSLSFSMEWPLASGQLQAFPEVDRAQFFSLAEARRKLKPAQCALIDRLEAELSKRRS